MTIVADPEFTAAEDSVDDPLRELLAKDPNKPEGAGISPTTRIRSSSWKAWAGGGVMVVLIAAAIAAFNNAARTDEQQPRAMGYVTAQDALVAARPATGSSQQAYDAPRAMAAKSVAGMQNGAIAGNRTTAAGAPQAPMIARTASLTILVKDYAAARAELDTILARYGGYSANLTIQTPENSQRRFQASLRIPANQLDSALSDFKKLGRTLNESQSGEEVTQQHADLDARLQNSRETEQRMRAILEQRTGKIEDVLEVEEEIARVRGEIESMESEQKALEHRVTFAALDLQLVEEFKEAFNSSPVSASGQLRNAFVEGMRHASGTALGLVLFLEEFGPAMLVWCVILGFPGYFVWRRYRKAHAHL